MSVNRVWVRIWKDTVMGYFKVFWNMVSLCKKNLEQLRIADSLTLKLQLGTS